MPYRTVAVALMLAACLPAAPKSAAMPAPAALEDGIAVYFSPDGGCLQAIVAAVGSAKRTLDVQAYMLTTKDIAGPVHEAHKRGVRVRVLMDSDNAATSYSAATYFANAGIAVFTDAEHKEAHDKVMIIDGQTVITGSFNFTKAADEKNAENLLVLTGKPKLAAAYAANFEAHLKHAKPYVKPAE